jgi:uncharacterized protein (DUF1015 family)
VLLARSPHNIVRVELPGDDSGDPYADAARTLKEWRSQGVLIRDDQACLYLYEVLFQLGDQEQTRRALVAALKLEPWESGQVLPHERTMAGPKEDRLRLLRATRANVSPVWTIYRGQSAALTRAWDLAAAREPDLSCRLEDETTHRVWKIADPAQTEAIQTDFAAIKAVIADGHHRYETAFRYREEVAAGSRAGPDGASFVMAHLVAADDPGLVILPTHRLVRGLGGLDQVELESELGSDWHGEYFPIWENAPPEQLEALLAQLLTQSESERALGLFGPDTSIFAILILRNRQLMEQRAPERTEAWRALDVALLDEGLLKPLLERAGANREACVGYERDPYTALQVVLRGDYQIALFVNATTAEQVIAVAESGERMHEKSTYFHPKPPTGLVMRELDE